MIGEVYKNEIIDDFENKFEFKDNSRMPIIDIIRHGETYYKELANSDFKFDLSDSNFKLDEEHLDLNQKGIENILKTAKSLVDRIDKENEVILFVTSPNYRAESSTLLIKNFLENKGIKVIDRYLKSKNIRQIGFKPKKDGGQFDLNSWREQDDRYHQGEVIGNNISTEKIHQEIVKRLEKEWDDIFSEDYDGINKRFERFLRHMININQYFSEATKRVIGNKRVRIVILTHEEVPTKYINKIFGRRLRKAQNLELRPSGELRLGGEINIKNILYSKSGDRIEKQVLIKKSYF